MNLSGRRGASVATVRRDLGLAPSQWTPLVPPGNRHPRRSTPTQRRTPTTAPELSDGAFCARGWGRARVSSGFAKRPHTNPARPSSKSPRWPRTRHALRVSSVCAGATEQQRRCSAYIGMRTLYDSLLPSRPMRVPLLAVRTRSRPSASRPHMRAAAPRARACNGGARMPPGQARSRELARARTIGQSSNCIPVLSQSRWRALTNWSSSRNAGPSRNCRLAVRNVVPVYRP